MAVKHSKCFKCGVDCYGYYCKDCFRINKCSGVSVWRKNRNGKREKEF